MKQTTDTVLMVRPIRFGFNEETAVTNSFQSQIPEFTSGQIQDIAMLEFDNAVSVLRSHDIEVLDVADSNEPHTPDSIFPNNWIMTHLLNGGERVLITFPMCTPNRRKERRPDIISQLKDRYGYAVWDDLLEFEKSGKYLEGTGSVVFDHGNKLACASISPRTDPDVLDAFCRKIGYTYFTFSSVDRERKPIYHTNVMLSIGEGFAVLGIDTIEDEKARSHLIGRLKESNHDIVQLTNEQIFEGFAGNVIQLRNKKGRKILIMSRTAFNVLLPDQLAALREHNDEIVPLPVHMIEKIGGGSARCMIAEIFH